jgi:GNAT superfamily N-acetyltransferase
MITVRPMEITDVVPLGELVLEALGQAPSSPRELDEYPGSPLLVGDEVSASEEDALAPLVAELGGALAGFACFERRTMARSSHVIEIRILVHPKARRQGVGGRLLEGAGRQGMCAPRATKLVMTLAQDDVALRATLRRATGWGCEQRSPGAYARGDDRVDVETWATFGLPQA